MEQNNEKIQQLLDGLNEDLAHEYAAAIMYTYRAAVVTGLYRSLLKPFFEEEISDEMGHALYLSDKIKTLGGTPTTTPAKVEQLTDVQEMLVVTYEAEKATIERYEKRKEQADRKSTRLNSSHVKISYAVFCLKKKKSGLINQ